MMSIRACKTAGKKVLSGGSTFESFLQVFSMCELSHPTGGVKPSSLCGKNTGDPGNSLILFKVTLLVGGCGSSSVQCFNTEEEKHNFFL